MDESTRIRVIGVCGLIEVAVNVGIIVRVRVKIGARARARFGVVAAELIRVVIVVMIGVFPHVHLVFAPMRFICDRVNG